MFSHVMRRASAVVAAVAALILLSTTAAFGLTFNPNLVISNGNMRAANSMSAAQVQAFLDAKGGVLRSYVAPDHSGVQKKASQIIWEACQAYNISPKVMLVMLQKEQTLITRKTVATNTLARAIGAGCPDSTTNRYPGFGNQMWNGARMLDGYGEGKTTSYIDLYYLGIPYEDIYQSPHVLLHPANIATYKLYVYNPSIGAKSPYGDLTAQASNLSGNANFWYIYKSWFGSPVGGDGTAPITTASVASPYSVISMIRLAAVDEAGGTGVGHTHYAVDGGAIQEGTGVHVRAAGGHKVEYWSVDRAGNEEIPHHTASFSVLAAPAGMQPVFRFYKKSNGTHFYTATGAECDSVVAKLWSTYSLNGVAYVINTKSASNSSPLYRFFNKKNGSHFYTVSVAERDRVKSRLAATYTYNGEAYRVCSANVAGSTPVYRFYNAKLGTHFYTASEQEKRNVVLNLSKTYRLEGAAFFVAP